MVGLGLQDLCTTETIMYIYIFFLIKGESKPHAKYITIFLSISVA